MEARFVVRPKLELRDFAAYARLLYGKARILFAMLCIVSWGLVFFVVGRDVVFIVYSTLVTLYTLFFPVMMGWRIRRGMNRKVKESELRFSEERVEITTNVDAGVSKYDAYVKVAADSGHYFLLVGKYSGYILPKRDFVEGEPAAFAAFITEKTGLEMKFVRG